MSLKVPAALNEKGKLIEVKDAAKSNGPYFCPACSKAVHIKQGSKVKHFYHQRDDCSWGYETALHIWAKEILSETKYIVLPDKNNFESSHWEIQSVELEKKTGDIRPDVILFTEKGRYAIEIAVTNFCDSHKVRKLNSHYNGALEIDLSKYRDQITKDELQAILINDSDCKSWLENQLVIDLHNIKDSGSSWQNLVIGVGAIGVLGYLMYKSDKSFGLKRRKGISKYRTKDGRY